MQIRLKKKWTSDISSGSVSEEIQNLLTNETFLGINCTTNTINALNCLFYCEKIIMTKIFPNITWPES
jgi:hypothetical protein